LSNCPRFYRRLQLRQVQSHAAERSEYKLTQEQAEARSTPVRKREVGGGEKCAARHRTAGQETRLEQWTGPNRTHRTKAGHRKCPCRKTRDWKRERRLDRTGRLDQTGLQNWTPTPVYLRGLPPYSPEDSTLPPIPGTPVDGEFLIQRYGLSKAAFYARKNYLPVVKGTRSGKKVHFSPEEVFLFDACDHYLRLGFSLQEIREAQEGLGDDLEQAPGEQVEVKPLGKTDTETSTLAVSPQAAQLSKDLGNLILQAVQAVAPKPERDPLRTLRLLEEAAKQQYVLTNKMLADTLEFKPDSVRSFKAIEHRHGYELRKLGPGKWRVRRLSEEELAADLAEEQEGRPNWFGHRDAA
jgi:hypothetical protein